MDGIVIRECFAIDELDNCAQLQKEVFGLADLEVSPRRHLIVSRQAGGWTLGAFVDDRLVGFVHYMVAVRHGNEIFGYSHMLAIARDYQNKGVGSMLKWSQRERAIREGRSLIKWTWDPMQARNAYFNLNRLGVTVSDFAANFYGTDYVTTPAQQGEELPGIDSDRLFANWQLQSRRVTNLANGSAARFTDKPKAMIVIPADWGKLFRQAPAQAKDEQLRVRHEFQRAFSAGFICAGFERSLEQPRYLLYERKALND